MPTLSPLYMPCAEENQTCMFVGKKSVAYQSVDKTGTINYRNPVDNVRCDNTHLGDPIVNGAKRCYFTHIPGDITYENGKPVGFTKCADENGECNPVINEPVDILYGAYGSYVYADAYETPCNSTIFGDPSPNNPKACYWRIRTIPGPPPKESTNLSIMTIIIIIVAIIIFLTIIGLILNYYTRYHSLS